LLRAVDNDERKESISADDGGRTLAVDDGWAVVLEAVVVPASRGRWKSMSATGAPCTCRHSNQLGSADYISRHIY